jgi:hypothetical protein
MRVRLYRNLSPQYRQQHAWSIMAMEGPRKGKVVEVVDGAILRNVRFVVSEAGRQRVLRDGVRNVHAFLDGHLAKTFALDSLPKDLDGEGLLPGSGATVLINYNPHHTPLMLRADCMEPVDSSELVVAATRGVYAKLPPCRRALRGRGPKVVDDLDGVRGLHLFDIDDWNG